MKKQNYEFIFYYYVQGAGYYFPSRKDALKFSKRIHRKLPSKYVKVFCEVVEDGYTICYGTYASTIKQAKINALVHLFHILKTNNS